MTVESLIPQNIADQNNLELVGETTKEGQATRSKVVLEDGRKGLLYVWTDAELAHRAAWCHSPEYGAQLFVIPELIASGEGWCVVEAIDGQPMSEILANNADWLSSSEAVGIVTSIGRMLRKLHTAKTYTHFGDVIEEGADRWLTFNGYVAANLEVFSESVRTIGVDDETATNLLNVIGHARHELASFHPRSPASLVHGRLAFEHIWLNEDRREVVGLTGFEYASSLPPEIDLAWVMWIDGIAADDRLVKELYRGYGAARTMDVQRRERFYKRLVALLGLFGAVGQSHRTQDDLIELAGARS